MVRAVAAVLWGLAACNFSGPAAAPPGDGDGDSDGDAGLDAPVDAAVLGPFQPPRRLTEIEAALFGDGVSIEYDDPSISNSGELLFAAASGDGQTQNADVFRAQLDTTDMTFTEIAPVPELSTSGFETTPHLSANGLNAVVATGGDLFMSSRLAVGDSWGDLEPIPEASNNLINSNSFEAFGQLSPDHTRLYFASNRDGDFDLFVATLDGNNEYDDVVKLSVSEDGRDEGTPRLSADELTLYFSAPNGDNDEDIFVATRSAIDQPFDQAEPVTELNTAARDADMSVSSDHRIGVFSSDREGAGPFRLYISVR